MKTKIQKIKDKIVIEIPATQKRFNPYMEEYYGSYPTLTGLVDKNDCGNIEMGFAYTIDMDYANKGDQFTDIFYKVYDMQEDEFAELCKKLEIQFFDLVAYTKLLKEACASPSETQSA